jgi:multidrug efflux system membrane fusion protein
VPVNTAVATPKDVPLQLRAIGTVRPYATVSVKPRVDGQLGQIGFKQGDDVKQGQLIFQIEPRAFEVALAQAEAILSRDQASLLNAEADMRRTDQLANTKAVSASAIDVNRARVASLRATIEADKAAIEIARVQLSYCSIRSPLNGRAGFVLVDVGNVVKNNETVLAVINQTQPIYVDFGIPQRSLSEVREAMSKHALQVAAANSSGRAEAAATGQLEVINNQVDTTTGLVLLRATFTNEHEALWPGQFLNVTLTLGHLTNATVVPSAAVQTGQAGEFVFVVTPDSMVEKRPVTLGPTLDGESVIQSGVSPGETVVTDGQLRLAPGSAVNTKPGDAGAPSKPGPARPAGGKQP